MILTRTFSKYVYMFDYIIYILKTKNKLSGFGVQCIFLNNYFTMIYETKIYIT